jgi:hypothetical protein
VPSAVPGLLPVGENKASMLWFWISKRPESSVPTLPFKIAAVYKDDQ